MLFVNEYVAIHRLLDANQIRYSQPLHDGVKEKLSGKDAAFVFEVFTRYIQATMEMHETGKRLYGPDSATSFSGFEVALREYETAQDLLVTAVYGPRILDL
jgi:hypothetical protein